VFAIYPFVELMIAQKTHHLETNSSPRYNI